MLFNLGFAAPLLGAFKPSIILFRIIAPHHLVRILDVLPRHRHRAPTTTHGHTTFTHPSYAIRPTITGCYTYQHQLVHLHLGRYLQYLSPTMGFFLAIFYFGESFGTAQLIAFGCIWVALILFTLSNRMTTRIKIKK